MKKVQAIAFKDQIDTKMPKVILKRYLMVKIY
jgi:hypothetical protein